MILDAVNCLALDFHPIANAPQLIAQEVADAYGDDEDGLDPARTALADTIAAGPRLRALAVVEAAVTAVRGSAGTYGGVCG
ncbi:hypothetical protein [Streptomyces brasiliensis]|uniref:Uncharacterized protein n=1 Tax=Streptomyces brasiliensis TaxID=1954 RepID=A0A917KTX1_9ACTN|nr:hypothetical protein [Streptomyces brasiliensis]GGJ27592.1 hypothetical protein GCM10010121_043600 [Streptomyces brasiliensis]